MLVSTEYLDFTLICTSLKLKNILHGSWVMLCIQNSYKVIVPVIDDKVDHKTHSVDSHLQKATWALGMDVTHPFPVSVEYKVKVHKIFFPSIYNIELPLVDQHINSFQ